MAGQTNASKELYEALCALNSAEECAAFLSDLCTPKEINALAERWLIARLLSRGGHSYREISTMTGASTTTIGRVARFLEQEPHNGYRLVLEKLDRKKAA